MARPGVRAGRGDLLEHDARPGQAHARAAVLLGDEGAEPTVPAERFHELRGIPVGFETLPVRAGELFTQLADRTTDLVELLREAEVHQVKTYSAPAVFSATRRRSSAGTSAS